MEQTQIVPATLKIRLPSDIFCQKLFQPIPIRKFSFMGKTLQSNLQKLIFQIFAICTLFGRNFSCRFGNITVTANVQSARLIECAVPQIPVGQFDLEIMDNRGSRIKLPDNVNICKNILFSFGFTYVRFSPQ